MANAADAQFSMCGVFCSQASAFVGHGTLLIADFFSLIIYLVHLLVRCLSWLRSSDDLNLLGPVSVQCTPFPSFFSPFSIHFLIFCCFALFLLFPSPIRFAYFLLLSIPSLSTRIIPLHFQAGCCRRRRSNLGLVCCVHFVLSVLLS